MKTGKIANTREGAGAWLFIETQYNIAKKHEEAYGSEGTLILFWTRWMSVQQGDFDPLW